MASTTRRAGVLLHPTSLPGPNGIGELGPAAHDWVDFLADADQTVWQVMPLGPTGYGDSPYQCFSAFATNPLFISLDRLVDDGLLEPSDLAPMRALPADRVDFGAVIPEKYALLRKAFHAFQSDAGAAQRGEFNGFVSRFEGWLNDYALFMALKDFHDGASWNQWPAELRDRHPAALGKAMEELGDRVDFQRWMQFVTINQWWEVRHHAMQRGVQVLGDMPIFVAYDSVDVWANRHLFKLDETGNPTVVAGVPPDYFSATGQRWGNPLYQWDSHRQEHFAWWEARMRTTFEVVDIVRIDHFRGFDACWEIPAHEETAVNGRWIPAPGHELFGTLRERMGEMNVVAENLGVITDAVEELRMAFGFPGMRVLQFAWDSGPTNVFAPHNHTVDSVVYTGTHDNNTTAGWVKQEATEKGLAYLAAHVGHPVEDVVAELLRLAHASPGEMAIAPLQDWLGLDESGRMNTPGQAAGNWSWRATSDQLTDDLAGRMRALAETYGRAPSTWSDDEDGDE